MDIKKFMKPGEKKQASENDKVVKFYTHRLQRIKNAKTKKPLLIFAAAVIGTVALLIGIQRHVYRDYTVLSSAKNEDTQSSGYTQIEDAILKFGDDGASLLSQSEKVLWNQTFGMSNPDANVRKDMAVIYDKKGTLMYVLKKDKPIGPIETKFPILKAKVTEKGTVAAILEDGEKTWINYYAADGSIIAENQTRMENPGYPLDLAVAPGGETVAVSYLYIDNGEISSRIMYYNFGDAGQNKVDNIVADFTYKGTVVPQIIYLNERTSVIFRDDGFTIYEGESIPKEKAKEKIKSEIVSTFYNDKYFGIVLKNADEADGEEYTMKVYDPSGRERISKGFSTEYQNISISNDMIIMFNDTRMRMYNLEGILKFDAESKEGAVKKLFQTSAKKYMMVSENGINTIKWK